MRTYEQRPVPQAVAVFHCDRCGSEIPSEKSSFQAPRLAEGSHISGIVHFGEGDQLHGGGRWLALKPVPAGTPDYNRNMAEHQAAQVDLCAGCTADLLIWFRDGR